MDGNFDLVIRGGLVFDGLGGEGVEADVAVSNGKIAQVGKISGSGTEEIDAKGKIVTPGFVDVHTHYDGQVLWEDRTEPSAAHGVTTAVMGNCGVGFAPCRKQDRQRLIHLMEGVEDVPEVVMAEGLPWNWESFEEYLDAVAARRRDIDVAAQLPHSCLRVYVMGERASEGQVATAEDRAEMQRLAASAVRAGAIGFGTSRSIFHRDRNGVSIPTMDSAEAELQAIAAGMASAGPSVIEAVSDFDDLENEFGIFKRLARKSGLPVSLLLVQTNYAPDAWVRTLELMSEANREGITMRGQVMGRPTGMVLGLDISFNPFSLHPSYQALAELPLAQRVAEMRKPDVRAKILADTPLESKFVSLRVLGKFSDMYPLGDPPIYEPAREDSIAARAARAGVTPAEQAYDEILADGGKAVLFAPIVNFVEGNLNNALTMLKHPHTILGLGDGGAHYGSICDGGYPTFMLTYWTRDRKVGERLSVGEVVKQLSSDTAGAVGLNDRGRIAQGYKGDLNVIDYDRLHLFAPKARYDLPGNGRRLIQEARGYTATILNGIPTYREGVATDALPGGLVRGQQKMPQPA
jgi:N-acyl-D-aspartate/D-glutamate deacylase